MKKLISILVLIISSISFAGFEKRNGGDGIYCRYPDKPEHMLRTLDFFESQIGIGPRMATAYEKIPFKGTTEHLLPVLRDLNKSLYPTLLNDIHVTGSLFFLRNLRVLDTPFENINDSNEIFYFPAVQQCKRIQLAINQKPLFKGQKIFYINILYSSLSAVDKHRLILHELFTLCSDYTTSEHIRYLANLLLSDELYRYDEKEIDELFKKVGIKYGLYNFTQCFEDVTTY